MYCSSSLDEGTSIMDMAVQSSTSYSIDVREKAHGISVFLPPPIPTPLFDPLSSRRCGVFKKLLINGHQIATFASSLSQGV